MFNKLVDSIKNIDPSIFKVMILGFKFSFIICFLALLLLIIHNTYPSSYIVYKSGLALFRTGLTFAVGFFICALATDIIKKEIT